MVDPEKLRWQLQTLRRRGYRFVPLLSFAAYLQAGGPPSGVCSLTFDDGTVDNLELLVPLLHDLGAPATVFACPGLLGTPHFSMGAGAGVRLMSADELRELAASPHIDIGSHTALHSDLSQAGSQEAYEQMAGSKAQLEELLGGTVETFAYPCCHYSAACPEAARRAGYKLAVTCAGLGGWRPFELAREGIDSLDGRLSFALKSRRLFWPLWRSAPGRLARAAARRRRHADARAA